MNKIEKLIEIKNPNGGKNLHRIALLSMEEAIHQIQEVKPFSSMEIVKAIHQGQSIFIQEFIFKKKAPSIEERAMDLILRMREALEDHDFGDFEKLEILSEIEELGSRIEMLNDLPYDPNGAY